MELPKNLFEQLINGVYSGEINLFELPTFLYAYTLGNLDSGFFSGFGAIPKGDIKEIEKAVNFRQNISRFSGAKTFQQVKDLTAYAFNPDGTKRPFAEFKKFAKTIDANYNKHWLATEQDTVILQAQNSRKWLKYEAEADVFPTLQYITVGDDRVRPDHVALDGLKLPVNHPLWKKIFPQNGWRCRCTVTQLRETATTSKTETEAKTKPILETFKKDKTFGYNPGMEDYIFKPNGVGKHDYFKVPRQFRDELKNNFGFPDVEEVTGKYI